MKRSDRAWRRGGVPGGVARGLVVLALVAGSAGCAVVHPVTTTPAASRTPAATPSEPVTSSPAATSASPTPTPTPTVTPTTPVEVPSVDATGTFALYAPVTKKLVGTCQTPDEQPTLTLSDQKNKYFETVDVEVVLEAGGDSVASVTVNLGEDSEGTTYALSYDPAAGVNGAAAVLSVKGRTYSVTGKMLMFENGSSKGELTPYAIAVTCASGDW